MGQVVFLNKWQRDRVSNLIIGKLFGTLSNKTITILGFAFKANTNDTRQSAAIFIAKDLLENGAKLKIYDPQVSKNNIEKELGLESSEVFLENDDGQWSYFSEYDDAINSADAVVILTEWEEFREIDWEYHSNLMRKPSWLFDTRNIVNRDIVKKTDINYWGLGFGE